MKTFPLFIAAWVLAGHGAVVGSVLGNGAGKPGLFAGAVIGGLVGIGAAVLIAAKMRWLPGADRLAAFVGGSVGFTLASPIAVSNLHTPITPMLICALAGLGSLLGVGVARGWRGNR